MEPLPSVLYFIGHVSPREERANENPGAYGGQTAHSFSQEDFRQFIDQTAAARREKKLLRIDVEHDESIVCGRINMLFEAKDGMFGCIGHVTRPDVIRAILDHKKQGLSASAYHIQTQAGYVRHLMSVSIVASPWYAERNTYIKMATTEPRNALNEFKVNYLPWARYINAGDRVVLENMPVYEPTDPKSKILDTATREHFLFPASPSTDPASFISRSWHTRHSADGGTTELPVSDTFERIAAMSASDPAAAIPQSTTTAAPAPVPANPTGAEVAHNPLAAHDVAMKEASPLTPPPTMTVVDTGKQVAPVQTPAAAASKQDLGERKTPSKRDAPMAPAVPPPAAKEPKHDESADGDIDFLHHLPKEKLRDLFTMAAKWNDVRKQHPALTELDPLKTLEYAKIGMESEQREAAAKREADLTLIKTAYGDDYTPDFQKTLEDPQEFQVHLRAARVLQDRRAKEEAAIAAKNAAQKASLEKYSSLLGNFGIPSALTNSTQRPASEVVVSSRDGATARPSFVPANGALANKSVGTVFTTPVAGADVGATRTEFQDTGRRGTLYGSTCVSYSMAEQVDSSADGVERRTLHPAVQEVLEGYFSAFPDKYGGVDPEDISEPFRGLAMAGSNVDQICNAMAAPASTRKSNFELHVTNEVNRYGRAAVEARLMEAARRQGLTDIVYTEGEMAR